MGGPLVGSDRESKAKQSKPMASIGKTQGGEKSPCESRLDRGCLTHGPSAQAQNPSPRDTCTYLCACASSVTQLSPGYLKLAWTTCRAEEMHGRRRRRRRRPPVAPYTYILYVPCEPALSSFIFNSFFLLPILRPGGAQGWHRPPPGPGFASAEESPLLVFSFCFFAFSASSPTALEGF